jgi:hypothetical protein
MLASEKNLLKRAEMIGFRRAEVARVAGVHVQTVGYLETKRAERRAHSRGPGTATVAKIERAIVSRELSVLDHLLPLHIEARADRIAELLRHRGFRVERAGEKDTDPSGAA